MNRSVWVIASLSIALTSLVTYQLTVSFNDDYVKKEELKSYFDQYVDQNTETIFSAFVKGAKLQEQAAVEKKRQAIVDSQQLLENNPTSPFIGNENGDVKIVMFSDYLCGYCKKSAPVLEQLLKNDANLKLIIKEYPILGPESFVSAKVALAAFKLDKNKFPALNQQLFIKPLASEKELLQLAKSVGLDGKALLLEMAKPEYDEIIQKNQTLASSLGISGTPAFIINGTLYPGAMGLDQLTAVIKTVREKSTDKTSK